MARELTDQQKRFLEALPGCGGNIRSAMAEAGYAKTTPQSVVITSLKDEIIDVTKQILAANAPYAAATLVETLSHATSPGIQHKLTAIKEILDRTGVIKEERINISNDGGGLFILPAKNTKVVELNGDDE
jgi:hypothetical protein